MGALFIAFLLLLQGIPLQPTQTGTIMGVLRNDDGKPAAGVRVAAMPQLESLQGDAGPTLSSIAETDADGRFTLENVPPGRYYVTAGRLDLPTFYPGTQSMALGQSVQVTPGATVRNIDFALNSSSTGRANAPAGFGFAASIGGPASGSTLLEVPLSVTVEGGGKLPFYSNGKYTQLKLTGNNADIFFPVTLKFFVLYPPVTDYKIAVEGLPDGYAVKSMKFGSVDLPDHLFKVTSFLGANAALFGAGTGAVRPSFNPSDVLSIVLSKTEPASTSGYRVRGSMDGSPRPLSLSGIPATVFSDGTFEFRNISVGSHILISRGNSPSTPLVAAIVVVKDKDLDNIKLENAATPVLPGNIQTLKAPEALAAGPAGLVPLLSIRGSVADSDSGMPVRTGTVYLVGDSWATYELGEEGKFEFEHLLPGNYELEIQGVGYPTMRREIVVEDKEIRLELKAG
jgi:hypothetical protein